jgi:hypothetical protein
MGLDAAAADTPAAAPVRPVPLPPLIPEKCPKQELALCWPAADIDIEKLDAELSREAASVQLLSTMP